jgi:hypothetical protein
LRLFTLSHGTASSYLHRYQTAIRKIAYVIKCNIARLEPCKKMVRKWLEGFVT